MGFRERKVVVTAGGNREPIDPIRFAGISSLSELPTMV